MRIPQLPLLRGPEDLSGVSFPHGVPAGRLRALAFPLALLLAGSGCQGLTGDSADRVAFGLREGANRLGQSHNATDSLTVRIPARTWPNGCPAAYRLQLLADTAKVSGIVVSCLPKGKQYSTSYAKRFVRTPVALEVERQGGQPVDVILRKRGNNVEVGGFEQP